jgi:hypothetical protein
MILAILNGQGPKALSFLYLKGVIPFGRDREIFKIA